MAIQDLTNHPEMGLILSKGIPFQFGSILSVTKLKSNTKLEALRVTVQPQRKQQHISQEEEEKHKLGRKIVE